MKNLAGNLDGQRITLTLRTKVVSMYNQYGNELVILTYSPGMHKAMNEVKVRNSPVRNGCGQESVSERSFT